MLSGPTTRTVDPMNARTTPVVLAVWFTRAWNAVRPVLLRAATSAVQAGAPALLGAGVGAMTLDVAAVAGIAAGAAAWTVLLNAVTAWRTDVLWLRRLKTGLEAAGGVVVAAGAGWWSASVADAAITAGLLAAISAAAVRDRQS